MSSSLDLLGLIGSVCVDFSVGSCLLIVSTGIPKKVLINKTNRLFDRIRYPHLHEIKIRIGLYKEQDSIADAAVIYSMAQVHRKKLIPQTLGVMPL